MTTTRATKTGHQVQMRNALDHGLTSVQFQSPKLRQMCRDTGRPTYYMTGAEYARERMGRGVRIMARYRWAEARAFRRRTTRTV